MRSVGRGLDGGCDHPARSNPGEAPARLAPATVAASRHAVACPRGRWRLAQGEDLERVVLWVSHVLVRDEHSDTEVPFNAGWNILPPAPRRTHSDALALATAIADRAAATPGSFASLAVEYSEDVSTKDGGGSLGGVAAGPLTGEPGVLDALSCLAAGEVSSPVETRHGFEILYRRPTPKRAQVAARRLVVSYAGLPPTSSAPSPAGRDRASAATIAADLAARLRTDPGAFQTLLSDHHYDDDSASGDIGVWTNQEPGPLGRERELLQEAAVGDVVGPVDSPAGYEVLVKTAPSPRPEYAAAVVELPYSDPGGGSPSREERLVTARSILATMRTAPAAFADFQREYCCVEPRRWSKVGARAGSPRRRPGCPSVLSPRSPSIATTPSCS